MRKLSLWARLHKGQARLGIIGLYIIINGLGILVGRLLKDQGYSLTNTWMVVFVLFFFLGFIFYPIKERKERGKRKQFYTRQKSFDFLLALSSFLMVIFLANRPETLFFNDSVLYATARAPLTQPKDSSISYKNIQSFSASMKDESGKNLKWKERKQLLRQQVKGIKKSNDLSDGEKVGLTILSVLVALGLLALVAAWSCDLSCSGSDGAAAIVGIGGTAIIIFLLVLVLRKIYGRKKKKKIQTG